MKTLQEIMDTMTLHMLQQGKKSVEYVADIKTPQCKYRTRSGLKCAVGALIPDELYSEKLEGNCSSGPRVTKILLLAGIPEDLIIFDTLENFQKIHDTLEPWQWPMHLLNQYTSAKLDAPERLYEVLAQYNMAPIV